MTDFLVAHCVWDPHGHMGTYEFSRLWLVVGRYGPTWKSVGKSGPVRLLYTAQEEDMIAHILWCAWHSRHVWYQASTFMGVSGFRDEKLLVQMVCGNVLWTWPEGSAKDDSNCRCGPVLRFPGSRKGQNFNHAYSFCSFFSHHSLTICMLAILRVCFSLWAKYNIGHLGMKLLSVLLLHFV